MWTQKKQVANLAKLPHLWTTIIITVWKIWQKIDVLLATSAKATYARVRSATQVQTKRVCSKWTVWTQLEWLLTENTAEYQ